MKLAVFSDTYDPQIDGVAVFVKNFVKHMAKEHEVVLFAPNYTNPLIKQTRTEKHDNLTIYRIPCAKMPVNKEVNIPVLLTTTAVRTLTKFQPDVVHINSPGVFGLVGVLYAKATKTPLVGTFHTDIKTIL